MPRLSKIGAAALAAFGWTGLSSVSASYLVVAGGGGGGIYGGGGGAGGFRTGTASLSPTQSYTVTVGAGGAGTGTQGVTGVSGNDSVFSTITSTGGGGGGVYGSGTTGSVGLNGGSGGGGGSPDTGGTVSGAGGSGNTPSTSPSQGNNGGTGTTNNSTYRTGGGGGGATSAGSNGGTTNGGDGGAGTASSISGSSVTYAGGGGGGTNRPSAGGAGGGGGGGTGGVSSGNGSNGTANLGGGGGGAGGGTGGTGGSGIVIISYVGAQQFGGGVVTSSGGNTIHTFNTSGTLSPLSSLTASYLIVAGGGGAGYAGAAGRGGAGGGGAGGLLSGSSLTLDTNSIYAVTVGAGGTGASSGSGSAGNGANGGNSTFSMVSTTAVGGGGGARGSATSLQGNSGGSGGGSATNDPSTTAGGAGTGGQGNTGGSVSSSTTYEVGGGGGGAGAAGSAGSTTGSSATGGNGGVGVSSSISGTATFYAGGGGGGADNRQTATYGTGGNGGGASASNNATGNSGTANLGGGGGSGATNGGNGGSGVVIISYAGSTQLMAGGTVTVAGGNVIHTFTSSGYLTPIVLVNNSLRFRSSASAFLSRTPASATNRKTWTWSAWAKRSNPSANGALFTARTGVGGTYFGISFQSAGDLRIESNSETAYPLYKTNALFRDPSAWYHIVVALDMTQATSTDRLKVYINGVLQTTASYNVPAQNTDLAVNSTETHLMGQQASGNYFDGYLAEVNFVDGQALTPNSFGTSNGLGVWQPIRYGGSYGTNGFYLPMNPGSSTYAAPFNGTSQVISVPANAAFNFSGNFTAECFVNTSTITNASQPTLFTIGTDAGGLVVGFFSGTFYCYMVGVGGYMAAATLPLNQWVHVAWVRVGSTNTLYLNGVASATATNSSTLSSTGGVTVGRTGSSGTAFDYFQGSVSNFRINNTALYTANFTPPTSPLTAVSGTQLLTLQSSTLIDNSTNAFTITNTGSVATVVSYPFNLNRTIDYSPQGNNWTNNNIGTVTGSTLDFMTDVPTLTSTTTANYCTWNPIFSFGNETFSNGNLQCNTGTNGGSIGTIGVTSGKWYWESISAYTNATRLIGVMNYSQYTTSMLNNTIYYQGNGTYSINNGSDITYGTATVVGDVVGIALDVDAQTVIFYKNGVAQGSALSISAIYTVGEVVVPAIIQSGGANKTIVNNWGQRGFAYTPPTGYLALNTFNLPTPTVGATASTTANKYMDNLIWTGDGTSTRTLTGLNFQPDFVWTKSRSNAYYHNLYDVVRGFGSAKSLHSNDTLAEGTLDLTYGYVSAATSTGFSVANGSTSGQYVNENGSTYVAWNWKANGTGVTNTAGSITSTVSANTTAGFSVVTWTGNGTIGATVGHGLGVAPSMFIVKQKSSAGESWATYHISLGATKYLDLNSTGAVATSISRWNNTAPTSSVFSLYNDAATNGNTSTYVAYCFAQVAGYSQFGTYRGDGSTNGTFVYLGFRPRFVMIKRTNSTGNWIIFDSARGTYNVNGPYLYANSSSAEGTSTTIGLDFLSNGFKNRNGYTDANLGGSTYIYMAFAENPFKYANAE